MFFILISFLAGLLTVLAPCILPLLPIVIGASDGDNRKISTKAVTIITTLSISVIIFTLLLKASTVLINIPQNFWNYFSGVLIIFVGIIIVFPNLWSKISLVSKLNLLSNKKLGLGYQKKNLAGDILIGFALGPVFTTCSPTYLFIIATVLPSNIFIGMIYLLSFTLGLATILFLIAFFGQSLINKFVSDNSLKFKKIFGFIILIIGISIITGYDKKLETFILDSGYNATINLEENLIDRFAK